jgi:DNA-binding IclR family transcriptional regulator
MPQTVHQPTLRVMNILELLADFPEGLNLSEIAKHIGSSKSTVLPILHTLAGRRFIFLNKKNRRYTVGIASYCVGAVYNTGKSAFTFIKNEMTHITGKTGEVCQMGILDNGCVLYIAKVDSNEPIRIASFVGKRLPAYCTALGKAMLSSKTIDEIKQLYPDGLSAYTDRTITDFSVLEEQLHEIRLNGIAYENSEITNQIECFAVPVYAGDGLLGAISVSAPSFRLTDAKKAVIFSALQESRVRIETYLKNNSVDIAMFTV